MIQEIPENPTIMYVAVALGSVLLTKGFDLITKKISNKKEIDLALLNKDVDGIDSVKEDLKLAYEKIKELENDLKMIESEKDIAQKNYEFTKKTITDIEFVLKMLCRQLIRRLKDDPDSLALVDEVTNYIENIRSNQTK